MVKPASTFYFYDLETSGFNPRRDRIMQFGGQRTDMELQPLGEPQDFLIKLTPDILPSPDAVFVTGITPQKTLEAGLTEVEFLKIFEQEIANPGTIFVGFNSIRFDDEFIRHCLYRNFRDAYEWQWKDGCSRFDLLDVARMTRALRPDGIEWPFDTDGRSSNRLGPLAAINKLEHTKAHNALSDAQTTIALARLLKQKQPKLFDWLLRLRDKKRVEEFAKTNDTFVYSSGKYPCEYQKTTVVSVIGSHPGRGGVLVYDLRHNPSQFASLSAPELAEAWKWKKDSKEIRLPIKSLLFNRCPAVAPLSVLDRPSQKRLDIDIKTINQHKKVLDDLVPEWAPKILVALGILDKQRQTTLSIDEMIDVDEQLYDGFFDSSDKAVMNAIRISLPTELMSYGEKLKDDRLQRLLPLYKARNYPLSLNDEERQQWEAYCYKRLMEGGESSALGKYFDRINQLSGGSNLSQQHRYILEELNLYGQSLWTNP